MVKATYPNKPGDFELDGVSLIILPDKIILDTGNRRTDERRYHRDDYRPNERKGGEKKKEPEKKRDWLNDMLDNAQTFVTGEKPKR